jgi:hypothetical protein
MSLRTSLLSRPCIVMAAALVSMAEVAPAFSADQGSVLIVAIAPALCRVTTAPRPPALTGVTFISATRACNTVNEAQITAQVSNLDGAALRLGADDIAVSANGMATFSPAQLSMLSDLHVVNGRVAERAPLLELTVTPQ